jgi:hypothetical protein
MRMKYRTSRWVAALLSLICFALFITCGEEEEDTELLNNYFAIGSSGDLVSLKIDTTENTYSFTNEGTNQSGEGSYSISTDQHLSGVYVTSNGHYIIELPDKAIITSIPLAGTSSLSPDNSIIFGLTSELNLNNETLTGDYIFIIYLDDGVDDAGGYRINSNGTFTYGIAPEPDSIVNFDYFEGDGSGTWEVSEDSSRILATEGNTQYYGSIYPGKLMLFDYEPGEGFIVGVKYPSSAITLAQVAGTYHGVDYLVETNEEGVGYYTLPSTSGPVDYYCKYSGSSGVVSGTTSGDVARHPGVNNLFQVDDDTDRAYFLLLPGEVMLHYVVDQPTGDLISYGIAAKIN